jgi:hypothetical protein
MEPVVPAHGRLARSKLNDQRARTRLFGAALGQRVSLLDGSVTSQGVRLRERCATGWAADALARRTWPSLCVQCRRSSNLGPCRR